MDFLNKNFAEIYENRLYSEGYPGNILDVITGEIGRSRTILDVGAGTGFFTIPLAEKGYSITVIEPSTEMLRILKAKAKKLKLDRINIINSKWEDWNGEKADLLISIHSIYKMKNTVKAIKKMRIYSNKALLLIKTDTGAVSISEIIRNKIKKNRRSSGFFDRVTSAFKELNIPYETREIVQNRTTQFDDLDLETEYYCNHLGLAKKDKESIKKLILGNTECKNGKYIFKGTYFDYLFTF